MLSAANNLLETDNNIFYHRICHILLQAEDADDRDMDHQIADDAKSAAAVNVSAETVL